MRRDFATQRMSLMSKVLAYAHLYWIAEFVYKLRPDAECASAIVVVMVMTTSPASVCSVNGLAAAQASW